MLCNRVVPLACAAVTITVAKLGGSLSPMIYLLTIFVAVSAGVATHVIVEIPMNRFLSKMLTLRATQSTA